MRFKFLYWGLLCASLLTVTSCGEDKDEPQQAPDTPEQLDPTQPVPDPSGTVTVNIRNNGDDGRIDIGSGLYVGIDNANNIYGYYYGRSVEIVNVGHVAGLGNIVEIPASGWKGKAAVVPGDGYVLRTTYYNYNTDVEEDRFARLYVVSYLESTGGGISGAVVKYQCPFQTPIKLSTKSLTFQAEEELTQIVKLLNPTAANVKKKPDWSEVQITGLDIQITVQPNYGGQERNGIITLGNDEGDVEITIKQLASSHPLFAAGSGTLEDPYLISTAQQLDNVRKSPASAFRQTKDIDLSSYIDPQGSGWEPISDFTGTYNGDFHTISGLWINRPTTDNIGLFGNDRKSSSFGDEPIFKGIILKLSDRGIVGSSNVAGICGYVSRDYSPVVYQCSVEGNITSSNEYASGIVNGGYYGSYGVRVDQCRYSGTLKSSNGRCDGIAYDSDVKNCMVIADIYSDHYSCAFGYNAENCYIIGEHSNNYRFSSNSSTHCYGWGNKTLDEMKMKATYEGWDFNTIWTINEGVSYPELRCFSK